MAEFTQGDARLVFSPDGVDWALSGGQVETDDGVGNAVALALFGGNAEDDGRVGNRKEWWGNAVLPEGSRLRSRTGHLTTTGRPLTSATRLDVEAAAKADLAPLVSSGLFEEVDARAFIEGPRNSRLVVAGSMGGDVRSWEYLSNEEARRRTTVDLPASLWEPFDPWLLGDLVAIYEADWGLTLDGARVVSWAPRWIRRLLAGETEAAVRASLTLSQATTAAQPLLASRPDVLPEVVWDGVDDVLTSPGLAAALPLGAYSLGLAGNLKGSANGGRCLWIGKHTAAVRPYSVGCSSDTTLSHWCNSSATATATGNINVPAGAIRGAYAMRRNGARLDALALGADQALALGAVACEEASTNFSLGARVTAAGGFDLFAALRLSALYVYASPVSPVELARAMEKRFPRI